MMLLCISTAMHSAFYTAVQASDKSLGLKARESQVVSRPIHLLCLSFFHCKIRIIKVHILKVEVKTN